MVKPFCEIYASNGAISIPNEVMEAAQLLTKWAEEQNLKYWRINGVASRQQLEEKEGPPHEPMFMFGEY